jgi:hypothetical protein
MREYIRPRLPIFYPISFPFIVPPGIELEISETKQVYLMMLIT